jgi:outer membrane receptor protein involved in Fe transport
MRGGRFHEGNAIAQARGALGDHAGLALGASLDTFRDPNSDGGFDGASLKAKLDGQLPGGIEASLVTRLHESSARGFPDSSGGSELAVLRDMEDRDVREWLVGAEARRHFDSARRLEFRASYANRREDLTSPGVDVIPPLDPLGEGDIPATRSGDEYDRWSLTALGTLDSPVTEILGVSHRTILTVGTNVLWEDGESDNYTLLDLGGGPVWLPQSFHEDRRTVGVFGELTHEIGEWISLSTSLRHDFVRGEKDRLSPAVGASIIIPESPFVLFGHYGEGFKLPSFYALGKPIVGNPNLRTETSRGWEIGLRMAPSGGRFRLQLAYFDLRVKELIDFDPAAFSLVNRDRLLSRGVEAELSWSPLDALDLRFGATWNHTEFDDSDLDPTGRPEWRGFVEVGLRPVDTLVVSARALLVSSMKATAFVNGAEVRTLNGYARIDLGLRWPIAEWITLIGELQNLTDATPREAIGFESPGLSARAGVELRL